MIPLAIPNLRGNENRYLQECIASNFVSSVGPFVKRFESQIASSFGARACVTTSSGTTALHLALLAAGVKPGDLVIVPSFTFIASANAISHCGATPWLFDIEPCAWTLDAEQLREELKIQVTRQNGEVIHRASGQRVAALMPVHVLGNPVDIEAMVEISAAYEIPLVIDGAAALGATYRDGSLNHPLALTTFSFNGNKTITCGGGGAICANDTGKIDFIRHISSTARVGTDYHHDQIGFNFRMTNIQAAVGCAQMEQLESFVQRKREIDVHYRGSFAGSKGLSPFPRPTWGESSCWFSGIVVNPQSPMGIDVLQSKLAAAGIESRPFWKPLHLQPPYQSAPRADLALTSEIWSRVLTLPCSTGITEEELQQVANAVLEQVLVKTA